MSDRRKITNISVSGVVIEDIGVYLPGRGDNSIVDAILIEKSRDFQEIKDLVRVDKVPKPMPIWPFHKSPPAVPKKEKAPEKGLGTVEQDIKAIRELLSQLLARPSAPSAEVVAAHLQVAKERRELLRSKELPLAIEEPMFVPKSIIPADAESVIKTEEAEITKDDFDGDLDALRKALKG